MASRVRLLVAYLGTPFAGWQRQKNARTVQGELEQALLRLYKRPVPTVGAGRTDAGVHAAGQVVHFDAPLAIPPSGVLAALNAFLPPEVRVLEAAAVAPSFHARWQAVGKRYCYRLAWGPVPPPWEALRRLWIPTAPNLELLSQVLALTTGAHDFRHFALAGHAGRGARGTVRTVYLAAIRRRPHGADLLFEGDGFLRGMVRRLVGAALEVATGRENLDWFLALLSGIPPAKVAPTAPALGLTLERVFYRTRRRWDRMSSPGAC